MEISSEMLLEALKEFLIKFKRIPRGRDIESVKFGPFPHHSTEWLEMFANDTIPLRIKLEEQEVTVEEYNGKG